jgi:hypothetical protein
MYTNKLILGAEVYAVVNAALEVLKELGHGAGFQLPSSETRMGTDCPHRFGVTIGGRMTANKLTFHRVSSCPFAVGSIFIATTDIDFVFS